MMSLLLLPHRHDSTAPTAEATRASVPFHQKRREAPAFMPGRDRRWARWAQCPRAQQDSRSTRALNGRGNCREGSPGIHAGEDVPSDATRSLWDLDMLESILNETLDLAKTRAVSLDGWTE